MRIHMKGNHTCHPVDIRAYFLIMKFRFSLKIFKLFSTNFYVCKHNVHIGFFYTHTHTFHNVIFAIDDSSNYRTIRENFRSIFNFGAIMNRHLSEEIKSRIISMRLYSSLTFEQIAAQCNCSVS